MNSAFNDSSPRSRIADILLIQDEEEEEKKDEVGDGDLLLMEGCTGVVSRWLSRFRAAKFKKISGQVDKREQDASSDVKCSIDVLNDGDSPRTDQLNHQSEPSFNLGVGFCLLYLIAASKNELHKMTELRTQMEMLLQDAKKELESKDKLANPSKSNDVFTYSTIDVREDVESSYHHSIQNTKTSYVLPESSTIMMCDQSSKCDTPKSEQCSKGMDPLEAELEAELERFLLHHPQQQSIEVTVKDTDSAKSKSFSSGEVIDPQEEEYTEVDYGVPPYELERRLHEVLEARQEERIRELDAALECARHKLREKEIEISWWKDTAKLLSQHIPATLRPTS